MTALKTLTFTTLPTQGGNPILGSARQSHCAAGGAKVGSERPELHPHKQEVGKEGWRKGYGRTPAARSIVVATTPERQLRIVCSERVEGNRVRKRQARNCGVIARTASTGLMSRSFIGMVESAKLLTIARAMSSILIECGCDTSYFKEN